MVDQTQVDGALHEALHGFQAGLVVDLKLDSGISGVEFFEDLEKIMLAEGIAGPDPQLPRLKILVLLEIAVDLVEFIESHLEMGVEQAALLGEGDAPAFSEKQFHLEVVLEGFHRLGNRGLGDEEFAGGLGKALLEGHLIEDPVGFKGIRHINTPNVKYYIY